MSGRIHVMISDGTSLVEDEQIRCGSSLLVVKSGAVAESPRSRRGQNRMWVSIFRAVFLRRRYLCFCEAHC